MIYEVGDLVRVADYKYRAYMEIMDEEMTEDGQMLYGKIKDEIVCIPASAVTFVSGGGKVEKTSSQDRRIRGKEAFFD